MNDSADSRPASALAVFDLDGTLVRGDSLLPFLVRYARHHRRWRALVTAGWPLLLYALRLVSARTLKERLLKSFLGGERREAIDEAARRFCDDWLTAHPLAAGMERLRMHQAAGHRIILLSASPDVYVPVIARRLGIDEVVCTRVAWESDICTGAIIGENCKGAAKLAMLREYLKTNDAPDDSYAYGDSRSDLPVLNWVRHGELLHSGQFRPVKASG